MVEYVTDAGREIFALSVSIIHAVDGAGMRAQYLDEFQRTWMQSLFPQIALIALGIGAIAVSLPGWPRFSESTRYVSSSAEVLTVAWIIVVGGNMRIVDLYFSRKSNELKLGSTLNSLYILAGIVLLGCPYHPMFIADIILSTYFAVAGFIRIARSLELELQSNREICWLACGTLSLVRSAALLSWLLYINMLFFALGLLCGIDLILDGFCGIIDKRTQS